MLGGLVHLADCFTHLGDSRGLFIASCTDLAHDVGHPAYRGHHLGHGGTGFVYQCRALLHTLDTGVDEVFYFLGGFGRTPCQGTDLRSHHCKASSLFTCACRLNRRVQSQDIGLEGDAINDADDVRNLSAGLVDALHRLNNLADHFSALNRHGGGALGELVGLLCAVGVLLDSGA